MNTASASGNELQSTVNQQEIKSGDHFFTPKFLGVITVLSAAIGDAENIWGSAGAAKRLWEMSGTTGAGAIVSTLVGCLAAYATQRSTENQTPQVEIETQAT